MAHFGRWVPAEELRDACAVGRDGVTARDIVEGAARYGLRLTGWRKQLDDLPATPLPAIAHWEFNHFVVLESVKPGEYRINDPANGRRTLGEEQFSRSFTGVVLTAEVGPDFAVGGERSGIVRRLWPWLASSRASLLFAALCGLMQAVPALVVPWLLSVFVDEVLSGERWAWGTRLVAAAVAAAAVLYVLSWLQHRCLNRLAVRLSVVNADGLVSHLLRLPSEYFARRFAGDLTQRVQSVDAVAMGASTQSVGIVIELVTSAVLLVFMVVYSPMLAGIVAALGLANIGLLYAVNRRRNDKNAQMRREQAMLSGIGTSGLAILGPMRAAAREDDLFQRWTGYQARELAARQGFVEMGYMLSSLPMLFALLTSAAVLGLGGWLVLGGHLTVGALLAFYVVATRFVQPMGRLVLLADAFKTLDASLRQIDDVLEAPAEAAPQLQHGRVATLNGNVQLAGRIEFRDVTFGYRASRPPLIEGFNLVVEPGQRVAVIGRTGSGKSTLMRLANGELQPWSGQILYDDVPVADVPFEVLHDSVASADQQIFLFAASVRENLTLWNASAPDHQLFAAAADALIHDEVMARPGGYDSMVEEGGANFSGGQRQRLEIARSLVSNPSVLLLDEATSALDAVTELRIDDALRRRGCTSLIVAHRLSTIRDCDEIVVLERGDVAERGVHDDLMADAEGLYRRLAHA